MGIKIIEECENLGMMLVTMCISIIDNVHIESKRSKAKWRKYIMAYRLVSKFIAASCNVRYYALIIDICMQKHVEDEYCFRHSDSYSIISRCHKNNT